MKSIVAKCNHEVEIQRNTFEKEKEMSVQELTVMKVVNQEETGLKTISLNKCIVIRAHYDMILRSWIIIAGSHV